MLSGLDAWPGRFVRSLRSSCGECGWAHLEWLSRSEAVCDGLDVAGAEVYVGRVESAWRCPACGDYGFFGPTEVG